MAYTSFEVDYCSLKPWLQHHKPNVDMRGGGVNIIRLTVSIQRLLQSQHQRTCCSLLKSLYE